MKGVCVCGGVCGGVCGDGLASARCRFCLSPPLRMAATVARLRGGRGFSPAPQVQEYIF